MPCVYRVRMAKEITVHLPCRMIRSFTRPEGGIPSSGTDTGNQTRRWLRFTAAMLNGMASRDVPRDAAAQQLRKSSGS